MCAMPKAALGRQTARNRAEPRWRERQAGPLVCARRWLLHPLPHTGWPWIDGLALDACNAWQDTRAGRAASAKAPSLPSASSTAPCAASGYAQQHSRAAGSQLRWAAMQALTMLRAGRVLSGSWRPLHRAPMLPGRATATLAGVNRLDKVQHGLAVAGAWTLAAH